MVQAFCRSIYSNYDTPPEHFNGETAVWLHRCEKIQQPEAQTSGRMAIKTHRENPASLGKAQVMIEGMEKP